MTSRQELERRLAALEADDGSEGEVCVAHIDAVDDTDREEWLTREEYVARYGEEPSGFAFGVDYRRDEA